MKARNSTLCKNRRVHNPARKIFPVVFLLLTFVAVITTDTQAQCPGGTQQASLNWDYLDYFPFNGTYSANGYLANNTQSRTQHFAFGTQRLTISHGYSDVNSLGENGNHTGSAGSFGSGDNIQFIGNSPGGGAGAVTFTFENEVQNLQFSIYDIDRSQRITFAAASAAPAAQPINLATVSGVLLTITNNNTTTARVDALPLSVDNASTDGTINVTIAGPVKTVTIIVGNTGTCSSGCGATGGNENGSFWISDIRACITGTFPINYYAVAQPFTGQPGYVLHAFNKSVYYVDPATGFTRLLFTDPVVNGNINSMAHDPYNRILYYVYSLTNGSGGVGNSRVLKKYDFNTEAISTVLADISTIGVRMSSTTGNESGSAAFYNGSMYIGIEPGNGSRNSNREATIWRLDFDGGGVPYRSSLAFSVPIDNGGGLLLHDWSDFVIHDGILYNFDAAENDRNAVAVVNRNESDIYHYDLLTGSAVNYHQPGAASAPIWYPGQPAINWAGTVVQMYANSGTQTTPQGQLPSTPYITNYNGAGGIGAPIPMFSTPMFTPGTPSLGDAAEAFRPKSDFGDAPASYDPDPMAPATHEVDPLLRLGANVVHEWNLTSSALADAEGVEEDAIGSAPVLNYDAILTYTVNNIQVFNNSGGDATLAAWLDYNFDGVFDAGEGVTLNIPTNAVTQSVSLSWNSIWVPFTTNLRTFLRIRLTRNDPSHLMTAASGMTGWFADGEVEDFEVVLGAALPKDMQSFSLVKQNNASVDVKWSINVQQPVTNFEILRSTDNTNWGTVGTVTAKTGFGLQNYVFADENPSDGTSWYRIRINYQANGGNKITEVKSIRIDNKNSFLKILPNPAVQYAELQVTAGKKGNATIQVYDNFGRTVVNQHRQVESGINTIRLDNLSAYPAGAYTVRVSVNGKVMTSQLIINNH